MTTEHSGEEWKGIGWAIAAVVLCLLIFSAASIGLNVCHGNCP